MARILAALATVPGREVALAAALTSLRSQVTEIRVVCHDMTDPPDCVRALADQWICEPDTRGSAAKLHWADDWTGLYLGCDDDLQYPEDYAQATLRWVRRWKGKALVAWAGRVLTDGRFEGPSHRSHFNKETTAQWLNYPCGAVIGFDTRLNVPSRVPGKSLEEAHLAVWAQQNRVPIFQVPHAEKLFPYLLEGTSLPTIWEQEKRAKFTNRNAVLLPHAKDHGWTVYR